ncbi:hypothetical protein OESDEN_10002 [Oesophagostomum dentatum]|uniref:Uncharacterized protein n=1 Tax=Oesophagostomum dentatum TaxID=61180 RepID=A0A0B1T321_OESDE|nr:hypothetical protein OESDEN_10002 [Oesophagostomum dentatum]
MGLIAAIQTLLTALLVLFSLYSLWYILIKQDIIDMDRIQRRRRRESERRIRGTVRMRQTQLRKKAAC